ncbi:hypothetical protein RIR_jg3296.t1 [Rhizophagus irregularis DAOM 181602=DAOM 197198]|nr:hypothetical protein RIR_jg3296.t1 [Rhizophagus irregularis DAOM 181602=DAOM 197198]
MLNIQTFLDIISMITCDTCAMIQCGNHPTGLVSVIRGYTKTLDIFLTQTLKEVLSRYDLKSEDTIAWNQFATSTFSTMILHIVTKNLTEKNFNMKSLAMKVLGGLIMQSRQLETNKRSDDDDDFDHLYSGITSARDCFLL